MTARLPVTLLGAALALSLSGCMFAGPSTPLAAAASHGDFATMTALLDHGADPNATGAFGMTPLAVAARNGQIQAIDVLLARGADPHRGCGVNGWTPLLHALHKNQIAAAERLADTCSAPSAELDQALFMAAGYAQTDAVVALLARGANPDRTYGDGANALANATAGAFDIDYTYQGCKEHTDTVRALLTAAPELKLAGRAGSSARRAAQRRECSELLALLDGR